MVAPSEGLGARLSENLTSDQVRDQRFSSPSFSLQGVPLHIRGAHLPGLPWQACHRGPGGEWAHQAGCELVSGSSIRDQDSQCIPDHSHSPCSPCRQGTFMGLLIGLAQLNCSELKLKRLCCRHG